MRIAQRIKNLPPYLFAELDRKISEEKKAGKEVITFGMGDPDLPTPRHIIDACCSAAKKPENHRYPSYEGMLEFRSAVAERYRRDFKLKLDSEREVIALIGSKEGVHNINFAFVEKGDVVLYPDPGYPVYKTGTLFAGGEAFAMPLSKENNFLPDLEAIAKEKIKKAKLMWINYPNNPTAAAADKAFYKEVVDFASDNNIVVCSDEAYSAIAFDGYKAPCFLEIKGAREVGIVFDSLSKTYNMAGWRIGYAAGNAEIIEALGKVKTNVDSGVSQIIQEAAIAALRGPQDCVKQNIKIYQERRDVFVRGLNELGLSCEKPRATFYVWLEVPNRNSLTFANMLLEKADVVCTPGVGFGECGEGFVRFALTQPVERIKEALERMEKVV
ncbi:MAG: LL-diaminopimelate aminotransferase [Methanobacteriota archaeon]